MRHKYRGCADVEWANANGETGAPFDLVLREAGAEPVFIEVKVRGRAHMRTSTTRAHAHKHVLQQLAAAINGLVDEVLLWR